MGQRGTDKNKPVLLVNICVSRFPEPGKIPTTHTHNQKQSKKRNTREEAARAKKTKSKEKVDKISAPHRTNNSNQQLITQEGIYQPEWNKKEKESKILIRKENDNNFGK